MIGSQLHRPYIKDVNYEMSLQTEATVRVCLCNTAEWSSSLCPLEVVVKLPVCCGQPRALVTSKFILGALLPYLDCSIAQPLLV